MYNIFVEYHGLEDYSIVLQISVFELDNYIAVFCKNNFLFVCYIADSMWILRKLFCWFEVSINAKIQLESFSSNLIVYKICQKKIVKRLISTNFCIIDNYLQLDNDHIALAYLKSIDQPILKLMFYRMWIFSCTHDLYKKEDNDSSVSKKCV